MSPQPASPASFSVAGAKAPVAVESSPAQYLTFLLGGEMFAVGILNIKEIIEYGAVTEIPMVPPFIRGVINLRGAVVPVIDLASSVLSSGGRWRMGRIVSLGVAIIVSHLPHASASVPLPHLTR